MQPKVFTYGQNRCSFKTSTGVHIKSEWVFRLGQNMQEQRAVKEGLTEESLALFDLLLKPNLAKADTNKIKKVAESLYKTLNQELQRIQDFAAKQSTRDEIKVKIKDFLWDENSGLPASFGPEEVDEKAELVFQHIFMQQRQSVRLRQFNSI